MASTTDWMDRHARPLGRVHPRSGFPDAGRWSWAQQRPARVPESDQWLAGARLRQLRSVVAVRRYRLSVALEALDELDHALLGALGWLGAGGGDPDEPSPDSRPNLAAAEWLKLYRLFDVLTRAADRDDWTTTAAGLRVPDADRIRARLVKIGLGALSQRDLIRVYISFLNGDEPVGVLPGGLAR